MKDINLAIVEDIKEVADSLASMANERAGFSCQQVYYNAEDAIVFLPENSPDIVLIDINLPGKSGIQAIEKLKPLLPNTQFCIFSMFEEPDKILESLKVGAKGYILKDTSPDDLFQSIIDLQNGGSPMSPVIARRIIDEFVFTPKDSKIEALSTLTKRESQLLDLLAEGLFYKEIAQKLDITTGTVKQHIHKIYSKLNVKNRTEAIKKINL